MANSVEEYSRKHGILHPRVIAFADKIFKNIGESASGWNALHAKVTIGDTLGRLSKRTDSEGNVHPTPVWVFNWRIRICEGFLNHPGRKYGNTLDLATPEGWGVLINELTHVKQRWEHGFWWVVRNLWLPWVPAADKLIGHDSSAEKESTDNERKAIAYVRDLPPVRLAWFKEVQTK